METEKLPLVALHHFLAPADRLQRAAILVVGNNKKDHRIAEGRNDSGNDKEQQPKDGKRQRSSRFTTSATANMLREQSEKPPESGTISERWQTLAGVLGD